MYVAHTKDSKTTFSRIQIEETYHELMIFPRVESLDGDQGKGTVTLISTTERDGDNSRPSEISCIHIKS